MKVIFGHRSKRRSKFKRSVWKWWPERTSATTSAKSFWTPFRAMRLQISMRRAAKLYDRNRFFSFFGRSAASHPLLKTARVKPSTFPDEDRNSSSPCGNGGRKELPELSAGRLDQTSWQPCGTNGRCVRNRVDERG